MALSSLLETSVLSANSCGTAADGDVHADNKSYPWIVPQLSILAKGAKGK